VSSHAESAFEEYGRFVSRRLSHVTASSLRPWTRRIRPLPRQHTWAPLPRCTSRHASPVNSDTRRPVCKATRSRVRSRRPIHVARSGAARRAVISGAVRKQINARSKRFWGMLSTR
jgi:hypothetical protein